MFFSLRRAEIPTLGHIRSQRRRRRNSPAQQAITNLVALVRQLSANDSRAGGVSLLVYCIRGTRLREIIRVNYDLFWGIICNEQVPIVLVITGLENEDDMDSWWRDNRGELEETMEMRFDGHVCVTSTKGKLNKAGRYTFDEEYQESVGKVRGLLESACASHLIPLRVEGEMWITSVEKRLKRYMLEYNQRTGQERRALQVEDRGQSNKSPGGGFKVSAFFGWSASTPSQPSEVQAHHSTPYHSGSSYGSSSSYNRSATLRQGEEPTKYSSQNRSWF